MRVGDFLLQRGWVTLDALARVLAEQHVAKMRLCSLLVSRGVVSFDNASRALGEQLGVASALRKHLVHRDQSVASMLPAALARRIVAMPIGKLGDGAVIVCVRDPSRANYGHIARSMPGRFVMAVAPAMYLERLVEHVYVPKVVVDVPIDIVVGSASGEVEVPVVVDDEPVEAAPPVVAAESEPPPAMARTASRALPVEVKRQDRQRDALDGVIATISDIDEREWLFDVAMGYIGTRWRAALLFEVRGDRAVAIRGHGTELITLPLASPSVVKLARDEHRLVHEQLDEPGDAQAALAKALGGATRPVAAPVAREGSEAVTLVLAVGEPLSMSEDPEDAAFDLSVLAETMGEAHARSTGG